ncbi:TonB-dependent receptor [Lysobacter bugurensis]|uniref:TonB-dependent receptor n=2 Tax=Cognatilysobacter bugurensis TaxID=543356 RepID=A0A918SUJ2_9GAMM|nr:TonB-dependent receptor [Lysobacter bugurensis]
MLPFHLAAAQNVATDNAAAPLAPTTAAAAANANAADLDRVVVVGRRLSLVGDAVSASEGTIGPAEIEARPLLRTGDLLEFVPGLVATQHSGSGKANQYFLRGFNLDHGTDFATFVDGMPVNMRTHGHGHGWTDLNFVIPEAVAEITYRKGPYYADVGDFASAGSARFRIADRVDDGNVEVGVGDDGYARGVVVDSFDAAGGSVLYAAELQRYDGPWDDIDEDVRKRSALLRYSAPTANGRWHIMGMAYRNRWNSADQIPARAVEQGLISEFGSLDTTVGGDASRESISAGWNGVALSGRLQAHVYAVRSSLDLWSNFTYLLDDPDNGDQFQQVDDRTLYGFGASQQWSRGADRWRVGVEGRYDDIDRVALLRTAGRQFVSAVRDDAVHEGSLGVFAAHEAHFGTRWRTYLGVRRDEYDFDVESALLLNSGDARAGITSYKASVAFAPSARTEWYASGGTGFHSNDARGTTIRVDPVTGEPASRVDPLVESIGAELGARLFSSQRFQATVALWALRLDSELVFVGDAGNTEASRPSARRGVELGGHWFGGERYTGHFEVSYSHARFRDDDPAGPEVPGAIPLVISAGIAGRYAHGWTANAQLRHFGRYPLIEDGSVESDGATIVNLRVGREWSRFGLFVDVLNALDSRDHDVDYFYASRLPGESASGVDDVHYHVFPRRSIRMSFAYRF